MNKLFLSILLILFSFSIFAASKCPTKIPANSKYDEYRVNCTQSELVALYKKEKRDVYVNGSIPYYGQRIKTFFGSPICKKNSKCKKGDQRCARRRDACRTGKVKQFNDWVREQYIKRDVPTQEEQSVRVAKGLLKTYEDQKILLEKKEIDDKKAKELAKRQIELANKENKRIEDAIVVVKERYQGLVDKVLEGGKDCTFKSCPGYHWTMAGLSKELGDLNSDLMTNQGHMASISNADAQLIAKSQKEAQQLQEVIKKLKQQQIVVDQEVATAKTAKEKRIALEKKRKLASDIEKATTAYEKKRASTKLYERAFMDLKLEGVSAKLLQSELKRFEGEVRQTMIGQYIDNQISNASIKMLKMICDKKNRAKMCDKASKEEGKIYDEFFNFLNNGKRKYGKGLEANPSVNKYRTEQEKALGVEKK